MNTSKNQEFGQKVRKQFLQNSIDHKDILNLTHFRRNPIGINLNTSSNDTVGVGYQASNKRLL